jgi:hypothetical protein
MSYESRLLAGILLIVLPTVMIGGVSILSLLVGDPSYMENPLRQDLWRAGHAHAGVWLILALMALRYPMPRPRTGSSISRMSAQYCWPSACSSSALASSGARHNGLRGSATGPFGILLGASPDVLKFGWTVRRRLHDATTHRPRAWPGARRPTG